ncbi:DUF2075 domain-containing protein [Apilactobacillus quenuiae]|uniref:DUF2075 domain-containing protein n=1 Tax=Apilactobacillus quenuiae TaxID=2008377 RepID=UPI000D01BC94|nr:DUF2075 domain-containing protein [Apilactobacillus quenuiae]
MNEKVKNSYTPIIKQYNYNINTNNEIIKSDNNNKFITRYPTVYIIIDKVKNNKFKAYVGETNNIIRRTNEHLKNESKRGDWNKLNKSDSAKIIVIAHKEFNKSLTLDIEDGLMRFLLSDKSIDHLNNRRVNGQDLYYTSQDFQQIFINMWQALSRDNINVFPDIDDIRNSSIFKASPFHKLTNEQLNAKDKIINKIEESYSMKDDKKNNLIVVEGSAGTGKTVLLSSLFTEINSINKSNFPKESYLLVNHNQQVEVYKNIAYKLGIKSIAGDDIVNKPTKFLNKHHIKDKKVDMLMIDEAHLLLTQGKQAYRGKNQLEDLIKRANIVVAVIDPNQVLTYEEYIEKSQYNEIINTAKENNSLIRLKQQNRMQANKNTIKWIENFISKNRILNIPKDKNYEIKIFNDPSELHRAIKYHDEAKENIINGLSRVVATFDWEYKNKKPKNSDYWKVSIGSFSLPWNLQLPVSKKYKKLSWAEQPQTIDEVGSTFTIQGFDLNYCGLIIGPSVKFRNGKVIYDPEFSHNKNARKQRTLSSGDKVDISKSLLNNELNVLMKRGVRGLYIYAVDEQLRAELLKRSK